MVYVLMMVIVFFYSGKGLFTTKKLEAGQYVLPYSGVYLENEPADSEDNYVYEVSHNKRKFW